MSEARVRIERDDRIAVVIVDSPPVNAIGALMRQGLHAAVESLDVDDSIDAVVLMAAGRTFVAGADITEFGKPSVPPDLPTVVHRIEHAEKPWIAALHGTVLGGGLELALGCHARVAARGTRFGLPEVTLGLVPGAGGTVRLPRLIGVEAALNMIGSGRPIDTGKAHASKLIDAVSGEDLRTDAVALAREFFAQNDHVPLSIRTPPASPSDADWLQHEQTLSTRSRGQIAPQRALACVRVSIEQPLEQAFAFERETFLELRDSEQSAALRHVFFAERKAHKPPELADVVAPSIQRPAVICGGTMGAGIAVEMSTAGLPVTVLERDSTSLARGRKAVSALLDASVKRGRISAGTRDARLAEIHFATDFGVLADHDLVLEAVFEDLEIKCDVFRQLGDVCAPDTILATNTSYLDPSLIAAATPQPERVLGLHFFSPAHIMKLLEVIPTAQTTEVTLGRAFMLAKALGKTPVIAGVCDGFIGNRLLKITRAQAERLLLVGHTPAEIDRAMRRFGMPMGPFEAQDLGGLDIAAHQRRAAHARGEQTFAPIADRLVAVDRLGQKSGGGWYDYAAGERQPLESAKVQAICAEESIRAGISSPPLDEIELAEHIVLPMIDEAVRIRAEGIARRDVDIDLVQILGFGFPRWRGGLMHHAHARGLDDIVKVLVEMSERGLCAPPGDALRAYADKGCAK